MKLTSRKGLTEAALSLLANFAKNKLFKEKIVALEQKSSLTNEEKLELNRLKGFNMLMNAVIVFGGQNFLPKNLNLPYFQINALEELVREGMKMSNIKMIESQAVFMQEDDAYLQADEDAILLEALNEDLDITMEADEYLEADNYDVIEVEDGIEEEI